jgi:Protein of unknown function (DUF3102)
MKTKSEEAIHQDNSEILKQLGEDFIKANAKLEESKVQLTAKHKMTFAEAVACGKILIQVKELTKHGGWLEWLRQYAKCSDRTAQRRIGLARNATQLSNVSNLTPKNLATAYVDMGIIKAKNYNGGKKPHAAPSDFLKVKGWANKICALLVKTNDKKRMAKEIESIVAWHDDYLQEMNTLQEAAKQDLTFEMAA